MAFFSEHKTKAQEFRTCWRSSVVRVFVIGKHTFRVRFVLQRCGSNPVRDTMAFITISLSPLASSVACLRASPLFDTAFITICLSPLRSDLACCKAIAIPLLATAIMTSSRSPLHKENRHLDDRQITHPIYVRLNQKKRDVRNFSARNSEAGNGSADFIFLEFFRSFC